MVPDEVTDAGAYIQQLAESLTNGLASLDRDVASALTNWTGAAADAFGEGWNDAKDGTATVLTALAAMGELLGVASATVANLDISTATSLRSLDLPELNLDA
ncbi:WXG100 family type VII secretion target [Nocardia lasii]|uniref:WXG100 family type VII secretion target n=1 Tax=Nocardia lasii TaxID=1616107 RepID=A0ABW1JLA8_9NOCA